MTNKISLYELLVVPKSTDMSNTESRSHSRTASDVKSHRRRSKRVWNSIPYTSGKRQPNSIRNALPVLNIFITSIGLDTLILSPIIPSSEEVRPT